MHFIISCPSCSKKLRFPIDKGRIKVKCACGYEFIADPDDTELFKKGNFDIGNKKSKKNSTFNKIGKNFFEINFKKMKSDIINVFLEFKYNIQNFKLLPTNDQKKMFMYIIMIIISITLITYIILFLLSRSSLNGMTI